MSTNVLSDLYAICIAVTDDDNTTALLFETDLITSWGAPTTPIRHAIAKETGLPLEHIMVGGTHSHSAPDTISDHPSIIRYLPYLQEQLIACAKEALADRKPATLSMAGN